MSFRWSWLAMALGLGCWTALAWLWHGPRSADADWTARAGLLTTAASAERYRAQRDALTALTRELYGEEAALWLVDATAPLTLETAGWDGNGRRLTEAAAAGFLARAATFQRERQGRFAFFILGGGLVVFLGGWLAGLQLERRCQDWRKVLLAGGVGDLPAGHAAATARLAAWLTETSARREALMERCLRLMFERNRLNLTLATVRRELAESRRVETPDVFERAGRPAASAPALAAMPESDLPAESRRARLEELARGEVASEADNRAEVFGGRRENGDGKMETGEGKMEMNSQAEAEFLSPTLSFGAVSLPSPETVLEETVEKSGVEKSGSSLSGSPGSRAVLKGAGGASGVARLMNERELTSPEDLLPFVPKFPGFSTMEALRGRENSTLLRIMPNEHELLLLAGTYGTESVAKVYQSWTRLLEGQFFASRDRLAQDGLNLCWLAPGRGFTVEDFQFSIASEVSDLHWVDGENVFLSVDFSVEIIEK